jgi:hypothetical protein
MGLISEARRESCGRFTYSSNNEFLLAFTPSRFFFQTSVVANVARVSVCSTFPELDSLAERFPCEVSGIPSERVRQHPPQNCLFVDTVQQKCV